MRRTILTVCLIYTAAVLLITLNESRIVALRPPLDRLLTEIGVALLAVGLIHILDHLALITQTAKAIEAESQKVFHTSLKDATDQIVNNVATRTDAALDIAQKKLIENSREASQVLQRQVESIKVMEQVNLVSIFPSRAYAASAIRSAIADSKNVKLMGISLSDFLRSQHSPFRDVWHDLIEAVKEHRKTCKILVIDPYCHGATLRSFCETANTELAGSLETDLINAAQHLRQIRGGLKDQSDLEVRFYQLPPTTFLCHLDTTTFVQQYYFWRERFSSWPVPLLQYMKPGSHNRSIHAEIEEHFDFIWRYASVDLDNFLPVPTRGLEWGAHISGMASVFVDKSRANARMRDQIRHSKKIQIQGITLKAFFAEGTQLARALIDRLADDKDFEICIMLLDPDSVQAKERAYREFLLSSGGDLSFDDFADKYYEQSKLYSDLRDTINKITRMKAFTEAGESRIQARTYKTAPHMFVLLGDHSAFVEQYSYGKLAGTISQRDTILGSDMPLIEFKDELDPVYMRIVTEIREQQDADTDELRPLPYPLIRSHFDYAWSQAFPVDVPRISRKTA